MGRTLNLGKRPVQKYTVISSLNLYMERHKNNTILKDHQQRDTCIMFIKILEVRITLLNYFIPIHPFLFFFFFPYLKHNKYLNNHTSHCKVKLWCFPRKNSPWNIYCFLQWRSHVYIQQQSTQNTYSWSQ